MDVSKTKRSLRLVKPGVGVKYKSTTTIPASLRHGFEPPAAAETAQQRAGGGAFSGGVDGYKQRIERYAHQIRQTDNVGEIIQLLDDALLETRALHSHDEVRAAREQVERAEQKIESLKNELEQLKKLVHADALTGAANRCGLDEAFTREAARADRRSTPLCIAMLDLDDFKLLNDTHGHQAGDTVLRHVVDIARETLRPNDIIARIGGEEFAILLPDTGLDAAVAVMYRLQRNLATSSFLPTGRRLPITFSAGVASRALNEQQGALTHRADVALYEAKRAGKNRVAAALP